MALRTEKLNQSITESADVEINPVTTAEAVMFPAIRNAKVNLKMNL